MHYAIIVFTPYCVSAGMCERLIDRIRAVVNFKIIARKTTRLTVSDIELMYPKLIGTEFFPAIVSCLTAGESVCLLVAADEVHAKINSVKGKFRYSQGKAVTTGIRNEFRKDDESFEFIFHSTDSNEESDVICLLVWGGKGDGGKEYLK